MAHRSGWSWVLCGSLLGSVLAGGMAGAAEEEHPAVNELTQRGVLRGYPEGKFEPNKPVTRLELAIILARLLRAIEANEAAAQPASPPKPAAKAARLPEGVPAWARGEFQFLADRGFVVEHPDLSRDLRKPVLQKDVKTGLVWALASLAKRGFIPPGDLAPPPPEPTPKP